MLRNTLRAVVIGLGLVTLTAGSLRAGEPRTHDGLFLRLSGGGGGAHTELSGAKMDGATTDINLAIGGSVARNLALHATLFGWLASDPNLQGLSASNADLDLTAYGGGATYYFMPANIYVSGSAGAATLSLDDAETDTGFMGELTVGKEWWVGGSWGLGLAGAVGYHVIPDGGDPHSWSGTSFALRFSATLN